MKVLESFALKSEQACYKKIYIAELNCVDRPGFMLFI